MSGGKVGCKRLLAQILEAAVDYGYLDRNPASGRRRRLKTDAPRRYFLDAEQVRALLDAAGTGHSSLRRSSRAVSESLRSVACVGATWISRVGAPGRLLQDRRRRPRGGSIATPVRGLAAHKAASRFSRPGDYVFPTEKGT